MPEYLAAARVACADAASASANGADLDDAENGEGNADADSDEVGGKSISLDPEKIKRKVLEHIAARDELAHKIPETGINLGMFTVSCAKIRTKLLDKHSAIVDGLKTLLSEDAVADAGDMYRGYQDILAELRKRPSNIEELTATEEYSDSLPDEVSKLQKRIDTMMAKYAVLDEFQHRLSGDRIREKWEVFGAPKGIFDEMDATRTFLEEEKSKYAQEQMDEQEIFDQDLKQLEQDVASLAQHSDLGRLKLVAQRVQHLRKRLDDADAAARTYNSREALFKMEITDYAVIAKLNKEFEPYEMLWTTVAAWTEGSAQWAETRFDAIDAPAVEASVGKYSRNLIKCRKAFARGGLNDVVAAVDQVKEQVDGFKPHLPIIMSMRSEGMRERHWEQIYAKLGFRFDLSAETMTLGKVISDEMKLTKPSSVEAIVKVGEISAKEYNIEVALDKMEAEWKEVELDILPYKDTGTSVLKGVDELMALLDEQVTMTQAMNFSAFKAPFEDRIARWDGKLSLVSEVLEEWIAVQRNWLYLQPIFDSPDINKQLPQEGKRFSQVDKTWRQTLASAEAHPLALKFCSSEKLLAKWTECSKFLDMVSKGLSDYLETKRAAFARFYFLSNDELLEILSETKDPAMVQPHLKKCFEGIKSVAFDEEKNYAHVLEGGRVRRAVGKNRSVWPQRGELDDVPG